MKKFGRIDCQSTARMLLTVTSRGSAPISNVRRSPTAAPISLANSSSMETQASSVSADHHSPSSNSLPSGNGSDQVKFASRWRGEPSSITSSHLGSATSFTLMTLPRVMGYRVSDRMSLSEKKPSSSDRSSGARFSKKWFGASTGSCACHWPISEVRTTDSSNINIIAMAKMTICSALARPRRCSPANATRQILPAKPPKERPPDSSAVATTKPSPITTHNPAITAPVTSALPLYHHINPTMARLPRKKSRLRCASATPRSARSTRSGEASPRRRSGGQAKKIRHTAAVTPPISTGLPPAAPGSTGNKVPSTLIKVSCSAHPRIQPTIVPIRPIQNRLLP